MIEISSVLPRNLRLYSEIFGNLRQHSENVWRMLGNVCLVFGTILENLRKSSESGRKSSENHQRRRHKYINIPINFINFIFIFSCSIRCVTHSLRSLVRYRVEHLKIKFISTRGHVISSMCVTATVCIITWVNK